MMKEAIIVAVVLLLPACATGSNLGPSYLYEEIFVENNSKEPIRNLTIRVAGSGGGAEKVFSCENIIPLGKCQGRFTQRRYKEGGFIVDWVSADSARQTADIGVEVPAYSSPGTPLRVVFPISPEGGMSAYFERSWRNP